MEERQTRQTALSDKAHEIVDFALAQRPDERTPLGLNHWLLALIECQPALVKELAPSIGAISEVQEQLYSQLCQGDLGEILRTDDFLAQLESCVQQHDRTVISECDLACAILAKAGYPVAGHNEDSDCDCDCDTIYVSFTADEPDEDCAPAVPSTECATPLLDKLGINLTRAAREGTLNPIIGRQEEVALMIETLCRCTKRNPALVGPAGVGKTAIVEGLAQRVVRGEVPNALKSLQIYMLPVSALVANCKYVGEFEERMLTLLREASQPGVVLFIDEAHTILGAGAGGRNGNDLANIIKPALARGDIACIAATTDEEYRLYLEADSALERRFQPIHVQELTPPQTLEILAHLRDQLAQRRGVEVPREQLEWIVSFAGQYLHNRYFPDKAVDILEQCVAYGVTQGKTLLTEEDVETVAQRMVGMPVAINDRLARLHDLLAKRSLLPDEAVTALINRLGMTMRGLDLRPIRPNLVMLLTGEAKTQSQALAEMVAECLFGAAERVISLDFSRFLTHADSSMLIGPPPGYIGFEGRVALHQVMQMPWCVIRCENLHACHPSARDILLHGLNEGMITLADGKRVYLSDSVILLTADIAPHNAIGFANEQIIGPEKTRDIAEKLLGEDLVEQVDLLCAHLRSDVTAQEQWLQESLLDDLRQRFRAQGVSLSFDQSLLPWLLARSSTHFTRLDWERLVEEHLCPAIIPHLPATRPQHELLLRVRAEGDYCRVERCSMN